MGQRGSEVFWEGVNGALRYQRGRGAPRVNPEGDPQSWGGVLWGQRAPG